jgi:hypothetical protein
VHRPDNSERCDEFVFNALRRTCDETRHAMQRRAWELTPEGQIHHHTFPMSAALGTAFAIRLAKSQDHHHTSTETWRIASDAGRGGGRYLQRAHGGRDSDSPCNHGSHGTGRLFAFITAKVSIIAALAAFLCLRRTESSVKGRRVERKGPESR